MRYKNRYLLIEVLHEVSHTKLETPPKAVRPGDIYNRCKICVHLVSLCLVVVVVPRLDSPVGCNRCISLNWARRAAA